MTEPAGETFVLVVSDDPLVREEMTYGFPAGIRIELVADSREAMAVMSDARPSVVVVDIQTGSAGGFSLARDMSQHGRLKDVPICMLLERPQDEWLAKEAGASHFLIKPIGAPELVSVVLGLVLPAA